MRSLKSQPNSLTKPDLATPPEICYDRKCENCVAFAILEGPQDSSKELLGECRYKPPKITPDDEGYPMSVWPIVTVKGWCMKFIKNGKI